MSEQLPTPQLAIGEPIAIVGIGCLFPKAPDQASYWRNIKAGRDALSAIPDSHWKPEDYYDPDPDAADKTYARKGGFLEPVAFNPLHYGIAPNTLEATDTTQLLSLVAAEQALTDAGYAVREKSAGGRAFDRSRTSVMLGVTGTLELVIPLGARLGHPHWRKALHEAGIPAATSEEIIARIAAGYVPWQEQSFPGLLGNVTAGRIANRLDLGGANCVVDAACASSIGAIHMAVMELSLGRCDMAISGGVDTFNDIFMYMCFSKTPALSASGDARPFSADADGTMLGEGVGVVVLKRLSDARRDGDHIRAVIKGIGASSDGAGNAIYAPSSSGQSRALRAAYQEAGVSPRSIELVEAHGTGTRVGDQVEADALNAVFSAAVETQGKSHSWCALGSVKSMIGHTKAAAGVAGIIKAVLALEHKVLPPSIKVSRPLESLIAGHSPVYLNTTVRPWIAQSAHPRRAAVSAFGFGGSNFHCVLEEAQREKAAPDWSGDQQLLAFSGGNQEALSEQLRSFQQAIDVHGSGSWPALRVAAKQTRDRFSATDHCRLVLVVDRARHRDGSLHTELKALSRHPDAVAAAYRGFYGEGQLSGQLALVFPGQGSQRTDMLKDLSCLFPPMLKRWQQLDEAMAYPAAEVRISERVYPLPVFDAPQSRLQSEALRATCTAQPALAAASLGLLDILSIFGVRAESYAGHSFGEFIALCAAGAISDRALLRLARQRGECMDRACAQTRSGMLAVSADCGTVQALIEAQSLDLVIANHNAPTQVVLSGTSAELEKARIALNARDLLPVPLNVAGAFHSPLMAAARESFTESLDVTRFKAPAQPVYSNVSAGRYGGDRAAVRALLAEQITAPVRFVEMIQCMYADGVRTFVEAGPGRVLQSLIAAILADQPHQVIALDAGCGKGPELEDLGSALAQLAAAGHALDLRRWDPAPPALAQPDAFSVPISGANHFEARPAPPMQHPLTTAQPQTPTVPAIPAPAPVMASPPPTPPNLDLIQSTLVALQKMQQDTSELHRRYLESQQSAQHSMELLIRQQLQAAGMATPPPRRHPPDSQPIAEPVVAAAPPPQPPAADPLPVNLPPVAAPGESLAGSVLASVLAIVAEKTGYPREVLTPDMSLDADLGIDSIKRVEIFSALSEQYAVVAGLSADEAAGLGTLAQIEALIAGTTSSNTPGHGDSGLPPLQAPAQTGPITRPEAAAGFVESIISVIADKTGYPHQALNLEMYLDEDLGIDSIKRVEILSALQDQYPQMPRPQADSLASLRTLADIAALLGSTGSTATTEDPTGPVLNTQPDAAALVQQIIADKTGYPAQMLTDDMQLEADLGIDSIKRVEIFSALQDRFPEAPVVPPEAMAGLQNIAAIVAYLGSETASPATTDRSPPAGTPCCALDNCADQAVAANPDLPAGPGNLASGLHRLTLQCADLREQERASIPMPADAVVGIRADDADLTGALRQAFEQRGIFSKWIPPDCQSPDHTITDLLIVSPAQTTTQTLADSFAVLREYGPQLQQAAARGPVLLATLSRLNGQFGLGPEDLDQPLSAGLGGMLKTAAREWPQLHCKSIDLPNCWEHRQELAEAIVTEMLLQGPLEVGLNPQGAVGLELVPEGLPTASSGQTPLLQPQDLVIVSGGARGISAAIASALARRYQPNLLLLGRSPAPEAEADWLRGLHGESAIKQAIHRHQGSALTPRAIESQYRQIMASREILETLEAIQAAGARAIYRSVDIRNLADLRHSIEAVRHAFGPVRGLVHGAGILADSFITDKTDTQFAAVLGAKCTGFMNLLDCMENQDPAFIVACSSTTARLGRRGQADYAAANECLNKLAQQAARRHTGSKVLSINWGPWDGGMVDARLRKVFHSEGVGLIPLATGADYLLGELASAPSPAVELIVLGPAPEPATACATRLATSTQTTAQSPAHESALQLCFTQQASLEAMPILAAHVIDSRAVVPVALMIEWLAQGALHCAPGLHFIGLEDFRVCKGITLEATQNLELRVLAGTLQRLDSDLGIREMVTVELHGERRLHARARIHLGENFPGVPNQRPALTHAPYTLQPYADSQCFMARHCRASVRSPVVTLAASAVWQNPRRRRPAGSKTLCDPSGRPIPWCWTPASR